MSDIIEQLRGVVGSENLLVGEDIHADYGHDEALTVSPELPDAVVLPQTTAEVSEILRLAQAQHVPVIARGSGTGLSGAAVAVPNAVLVCFERMNRIFEIDTNNHVAVVQPGVTLEQLDLATAEHRLVYPVFPGENSASIGGNVATNAGGMRAVKYGVTRHQVLGLEVVLPGGEVVRTGGKFVKSSSGYDLTQLIAGSEGTLALVTEATLKLYPRPEHAATVLAPFPDLRAVTVAVPKIIGSGIGPRVLEYIDELTMGAITANVGLDLGIPEDIHKLSRAYLVVVLESAHEDRIDEDVGALGSLLNDLGALDVYVLPSHAAEQLITARERAFFVAKAAGANDLVDVVVPRASVPDYLSAAAAMAEANGALVTGCGHVGDGNVHLSVFQPDPELRVELMRGLLKAGIDHGGAITGEHGVGTEKRRYFMEFEDPVKLALMRKIKAAFDPHGILGPGRIFE